MVGYTASVGKFPRFKQPPFSFFLVQMCMDWQGNITHFPCGSYIEQMRQEWGKRELELMKITFRAWRFANKPPEKWDDTDLSFMSHLAKGHEL